MATVQSLGDDTRADHALDVVHCVGGLRAWPMDKCTNKDVGRSERETQTFVNGHRREDKARPDKTTLWWFMCVDNETFTTDGQSLLFLCKFGKGADVRVCKYAKQNI